jgi:hypothetical protein
MKIVKSLILILVLTGATYAGDMPTFGATAVSPPAPSQKASNGAVATILVAIVQNLMSLL